MKSIAVSLPRSLDQRICTDVERHGYHVALRTTTGEKLKGLITTGGLDAVICGAGPDHLSSGLLAACDDAGVRLVALVSNDSDRRYASDLGLYEVIDGEAAWCDIEHLLTAGIALTRPDNPAQRRQNEHRGEVIAVWGPAGAPGRTTIAITIAAELAAEGHSVALADADTHSGAIAPTLGLLDEAPGFAAACRLAGSDSLTTAELERISERYLSPHGSFWVLTGIGRPHRWPELSDERVVATVAACRKWVDYTVIDTGFCLESDEEISSDMFAPRRNAATISALREADRVVAVGSGDPVGLSRFLRAHIDLVEIVDAERVLTAVNRIRRSVIGANPSAQVEQTLRRFGGIEMPVLIPYDQGALDTAILAGKTLRDVAGKSAPRVAVSKFVASRILLHPTDAPTHRKKRTSSVSQPDDLRRNENFYSRRAGSVTRTDR